MPNLTPDIVATIDWGNAIAIGSAFLALIGVILGGAISSRAQRRHWKLAEQGNAGAGLLREYAGLQVHLAAVARGGTVVGNDSSADFLDWGPWNEALGILSLMADEQIVASAIALDSVVWEVSLGLRGGGVTWANWRTSLDRLETARLDFVNVTRATLGKKGAPLRQLTGRPPAGNIAWTTGHPTP